jgi:hypothetical protein
MWLEAVVEMEGKLGKAPQRLARREQTEPAMEAAVQRLAADHPRPLPEELAVRALSYYDSLHFSKTKKHTIKI